MALNGAGEYLGCLSSGRGVQEAVLSISLCLCPLDVDDFTWEPPTEAETKVLQARRERQDRISRLMGDYLLRGYRMLGDTCADCGVRPVMRLRPRTKPHDLSSPLLWTLSLRLTYVHVLSGFQTILLQDKQRKIYCVACQELDSDVDKDNPGEGSSVPYGEKNVVIATQEL